VARGSASARTFRKSGDQGEIAGGHRCTAAGITEHCPGLGGGPTGGTAGSSV